MTTIATRAIVANSRCHRRFRRSASTPLCGDEVIAYLLEQDDVTCRQDDVTKNVTTGGRAATPRLRGDSTLNDNTSPTQPTVTAPNTVTVTPTTMNCKEGNRGGYTVVLRNAPIDTVTITIESGSYDSTMTTANRDNNLVFTTSNWNVPKQVHVWTRQDDNKTDDTVTFAHIATGGGYNNVNIPKVIVSVTDN